MIHSASGSAYYFTPYNFVSFWPSKNRYNRLPPKLQRTAVGSAAQPFCLGVDDRVSSCRSPCPIYFAPCGTKEGGAEEADEYSYN